MKMFAEMIADQEYLIGSKDHKDAFVYLIEIIFKNGTSKEFWCTDFSISGGSYNWKALFSGEVPINFNPDDISSIWQKEVRAISKEDYLKHPRTFARFKDHFEKE